MWTEQSKRAQDISEPLDFSFILSLSYPCGRKERAIPWAGSLGDGGSNNDLGEKMKIQKRGHAGQFKANKSKRAGPTGRGLESSFFFAGRGKHGATQFGLLTVDGVPYYTI